MQKISSSPPLDFPLPDPVIRLWHSVTFNLLIAFTASNIPGWDVGWKHIRHQRRFSWGGTSQVQLVEWKLTPRIKTISLGVIARFKSENPDFDIDFETFVKELTTDETVIDVDGTVN
jgi:hypothetical protein